MQYVFRIFSTKDNNFEKNTYRRIRDIPAVTTKFSHNKCNQVSAHCITFLKLVFLKAIFKIRGFDLKKKFNKNVWTIQIQNYKIIKRKRH